MEEIQQLENLDSVTWAFKKLRELNHSKKVIVDQYIKEINHLEEWKSLSLSPIEKQIEYYTNLIQSYHMHHTETKTINTPYGKSKSRKVSKTIEKTDEKQLLEYVNTNDLSEFIKESINWAELKKTIRIVEVEGELQAIDDNGQVVTGVTCKPERISYTLDVAE